MSITPARISPVARPIVGVCWMLLTGLLFVGVTAVVKHVGSDVPAAQAAFIRYALGLVFIVPVIPLMIRTRLTGRMFGLFAARGTAHSLGVALWFFAMTQIPIAEVTALGYVSPVYVTIGAAIFLGEKLALRRLAAVGVALLGAVVILRPGVREIAPGHLAMMVNAVLFAMSYLIAKSMADRFPPAVVVGWLSVFVTLGLAPFAFAVWVRPDPTDVAWLFLVAALATGGHFTMTLALRAAPVSVTQPVTFLQLVWAIALGALVFGEPVDGWVVFGGALILGAVSFITWREAQLKRRAVTPGAMATKV